MSGRILRLVFLFLVLTGLSAFRALAVSAAEPGAAPGLAVPILLYHRFGPTIADSMTVTTTAFATSLEILKEEGYTVIPLRQLVDFYYGRGPAPGPRSVVITVDDGHRSVYSDMFPLVLKYRVPVTLFIYPSAISNAAYALTWEQLREMRRSGLVDCQSHTFWHPNFLKEKKRLPPVEYDKFVAMQLGKAKTILTRELGEPVDLLAWTFGIYDEDLTRRAIEAGYVAAFTMEARPAGPRENVMTLPRYLISGANADRTLRRLLGNR